MLLSIPSTLGDPCPPPSPLKTLAQSSDWCMSHQDHPLACFHILRDVQTLSPLARMESVHCPQLQARKAWDACTLLRGHSTWLRPTPPALWEPLGHQSPELPHLPQAHHATSWGRTPCGAGLCAIPGGPCSIRTGVGTLCSAAATGGCCTEQGCCEEGDMSHTLPRTGQQGLTQSQGDWPRGAGQ